MTKFFILFLSIFGISGSWVLLGEVVPFAHPEFRSVGTVTATAITENEEVFIVGDFDEVDGVARPGLAKLTRGGRLDGSFLPVVAPGSLPLDSFGLIDFYRPAQNYRFWSGRVLGYLADRPGGFRPIQLYSLGNGRLFLRNQSAWTVLNAMGEIDGNALAMFSRDEPAPVPQFQKGNRLFLIDDERKLVAVDLGGDDVIDESFTLDPGFDGPVLQAIGARNGIWILTRRGRFDVVCRLLLDGMMDPDFPPLELRDGLVHELCPGYLGGFVVMGRFNGPYITCAALGGCGPPSSFANVRWFSEIGGERDEVEIRFRGYLAPLMMVDSSFSVTYQLDGRWYSKSSTGEAVLLERIESASPSGSTELPLQVGTVEEVGGGSVFQRSILVGGTRLFDRSREPVADWQVPRLTRSSSISKVVRQDDGSYFVQGDFGQGLVKVSAEGEVDPLFHPEVDLRFLQDFEVKDNGEVFALLNRPYLDEGLVSGRLLRLSATGVVLQKYLDRIPDDYDRFFRIVLLADQSLVVTDGSQRILRVPSRSFFLAGSFQKIAPNGDFDSDWKISDPQQLGFGRWGGASGALGLRDGSFLMGRRRVSADGVLRPGIPGDGAVRILDEGPEGWVYFVESALGQRVRRWMPSEGVDPDFVVVLAGRYDSIFKITFGGRQKLYFHGSFGMASGQRSLIRVHGSGQIDHTFREPDLRIQTAPSDVAEVLTSDGLVGADEAELSAGVRSVSSFVADGRLLLFGLFDGPSANVLALADDHVSGYAEWSSATMGGVEAGAGDFDQDGASNLEEYALGSDPASVDLRGQRVLQSEGAVFEVPCNPEAPEVMRLIEVSGDLVDWRTGNANEVTLETRAACFRYRLDPTQGRLFSRIRYSLR